MSWSSRWVQAPAGVTEREGLAAGFRAAGVRAGIKPSGDPDLALLVSDEPDTVSAARFTRSGVLAAPVVLCQERCRLDALRAIVVNSGNANAATGEQGYADAVAMQERCAAAIGVEAAAVAVAETGTIGVPLDVDRVLDGIDRAAASTGPAGGADFSAAIMTTDAGPKRCCITAGGVTVSAQAKGAGMIEPGYATMLCFVQTDAVVSDPDRTLRGAVAESFERITVDGQMSTNDTVLLQATGASGLPLPDGVLEAVLLQLALAIVADGEGASRVGRIEVRGAAEPGEAERVARAVANSPLVKTALYGRDPNWGRIAQAAGQALAGADIGELGPERVDAAELGGDGPEAGLSIDLGRGGASAHVFFSDLTHDYIRINAEYTT